jgi:hypothetical protein
VSSCANEFSTKRMGQSDSKLDLKQHIVRLYQDSGGVDINEESYWNQLFGLPRQVEDVFSLVSPADIRKIRDQKPANLRMLLRKVRIPFS